MRDLRASWRRWAPELLRREPGTLALLLLLSLAAWGFVSLAGEVVEGDTHGTDRALLMALRTPGFADDPLGPEWVEEMGRDVTALGSVSVLALLTLVVAGFLWIDRKPHAAWFVLLAVGGGFLVGHLLKDLFDRPRPDLVPHAAMVFTTSFPSGHSMLSAVTFLTLGALLARVHRRRAVKGYVLGAAVVLTLLVGASRVYLGVHWPTDVLAGWTAGAAWALLCWTVARWLQRRGQVEEGSEAEEGPDDTPAAAS
ncbi:MAG TPA: phosphatase PAP2 family protein [Thermoanaerobaculia bacterium]|nr:phosphatase PAP2 family protein [Thermoanaerobaculia bacterium]